MMKYFFDTVIIGSGCAALNAAHWLASSGKEVAIVTEGLNMGTSRNTGSDKQTYYKLSLSGKGEDSVYKMAKTLFSGGCTDGDNALSEAVGSTECFFKLANLGVKFPRNEYGEYVGYRTDHDETARATSAGPYTSRDMTVVLEKAAFDAGAKLFDGYTAAKIAVKDGRAYGVVAIKKNEKNDLGLTCFGCNNLIVATGGPAGIYLDSVFPLSQTGSSGMLIEAGVKMCNLSEWQYGLASTKFRWNLSGTYQQVLPRYISTDQNGGDEREFLNEYFPDDGGVNAVFRKGYEWPFDAAKRKRSSLVDIAVYNEKQKGRRVFMDFMHASRFYDESLLDDETRSYLVNSGALEGTPIERLKIMNPAAIDLYLDHGINLETEYLEIAVCAQHNNGGADVDGSYRTCIDGLYVIGEAAGTLGVVRPGGSALNACQVGGMRAARDIMKTKRETDKCEGETVLDCAAGTVRETLKNAQEEKTFHNIRNEMKALMSKSFAFLRDDKEMHDGIARLEQMQQELALCGAGGDCVGFIKTRDSLISALTVAKSMLRSALDSGSRGSAMVTVGGVFQEENKEKRSEKLIIENGNTYYRPVRPIPDGEQWFEKVWARYRKEEL